MKPVVACFVVAMMLASCSSSPTRAAKTGAAKAATARAPTLYTVEFRVTNQSLHRPIAFVAVSVDGVRVFSGGLHVARQHNYLRFVTTLAKHPERITVTTNSSAIEDAGGADTKETAVDPGKALRFDISVNGESIRTEQVETFGFVL